MLRFLRPTFVVFGLLGLVCRFTAIGAETGVPWPDFDVSEGRVERLERAVRFHLKSMPANGRIEFPRINNVLRLITAVGQPEVGVLKLTQTPTTWSIGIPAKLRFPATIEMELAQPVQWVTGAPFVANASPDGAVVLEARHAVVHGEKLQFEPQPHKNTVGYWVHVDDWVEWQLSIEVPGHYRVRMLQGCGAGQGGSDVALTVGGEAQTVTIRDTGHFQNFEWRTVGNVELAAGVQSLSLRPIKIRRNAVMDVRQIRLEPQADAQTQTPRDVAEVAPDLIVPPLQPTDEPGAGIRVRRSVAATSNDDRAYHTLYLPTNWKADQRFPVLVELCGNGPYENSRGDRCSGRVEDGKLGFGVSGGFDFIWLTLPFLNGEGTANVTTWWGDAPDYAVGPTLEYWRRAIDEVCRKFGGDPRRLVLVGFSRGSLACNYLGLHDDQIASLWRGFICYSHYDGVLTHWPYPNCDADAALARLTRLSGRPQLICSEEGAGAGSLAATQSFLQQSPTSLESIEFLPTGFHNHADEWVLRPSASRARLRRWLAEVVAVEAAR